MLNGRLLTMYCAEAKVSIGMEASMCARFGVRMVT